MSQDSDLQQRPKGSRADAPFKGMKRDPKKGDMEINISLGNDREDPWVFVGGCEEGDFRIKRGVNIIVPASVVTRLKDAVQGIPEQDEEDPNKVNMVDRQRFPFTINRVF